MPGRLETKSVIIPCSKLSETGSSGREGGKADLSEFEHNLLQPYLKCLLCGNGKALGFSDTRFVLPLSNPFKQAGLKLQAGT